MQRLYIAEPNINEGSAMVNPNCALRNCSKNATKSRPFRRRPGVSLDYCASFIETHFRVGVTNPRQQPAPSFTSHRRPMSAGPPQAPPYRHPHASRRVASLNIREWAETESAHTDTTHVSAPTEVACFSRASSRRIDFGSRAELKRFRDPPNGANLADGFQAFVPKDEREGNGVEPVVECLLRSGYDVDSQADIVSYRNNLNKIGNAPYNHRDPFEFDAVKVGKTCFLDIRKLDERPPDNNHRRFMYMGYRFEALCTGHDLREPVNANSEFCALMRTRIGNTRIVLCAEMDAELAGPVPPGKTPYVELKTTKQPASVRDYRTQYVFKYQKWFLQSYLAGVRTLFVGHRDEHGNLVDVDHVSTWSLHRSAKNFVEQQSENEGSRRPQKQCWEPFVSINCIEMVCDNVRRVCGDNEGRTIRFSFDARRGVLEGNLVADAADADSSFGARMRYVLGR